MLIQNVFSFIGVMILIIIALILRYIQERKDKDISIDSTESKLDQFCNRHYKKIWIVFVILIFITVIYQFGELPKYMGCDEAGMAYDSYCIANYGVDRYLNSYPLYLMNFGSGQSVLCSYIAVFFIKIFGTNMISYRMPSLLIYLLGLIASYLFVSKWKDKKTALLFSFIILTCPWNIVTARETLDCNLYAGMFMISLFLMNRAKKNYQYVLAGVLVGLTLYTYCLSWITIPIFLLAWIMYMLYLKKITIKQVILFGVPIAILAMPLIYFLLLNYGVVNTTQLGIFSVPILREFRGEQIAISNLWKTSLESINTILLQENTIYFCYIPLFLIGYGLSIGKTIKSIKEKKYSVTAVMTVAFTTLLFGLLLTRIPTANKANVLYIPILYFVTIAILEICKNSKAILIAFIIIILILFVHFEYDYYTAYSLTPSNTWYEDSDLREVTNIIESNEETKRVKKHVMTNKAAQFIYPVLERKISPYEFSNSVEIKIYNGVVLETTKVGDYYFYSYYYDKNSIKELEFTEEDGIFIISKSFKDIAIYIENEGYKKQEYGQLYIFTNDKVKLEL